MLPTSHNSGSSALHPSPVIKYQFVISFNALCSIFVLRAAMSVYVTGDCEGIYSESVRLYRSDRTLLGQIQDTAVYWTGIIKKIWQL
jgi:hypothetical protein